MLKLEKESNSKNVLVIKDAQGHNVVMINDIIFRGKIQCFSCGNDSKT